MNLKPYNNMKTISLFFMISLIISGVFGDESERVSVNDGDSVTLHTHLTELQTDHLIVWWFKGTRIARINREVNSDPVYDSDVRFTDRLKMNPQTGDLTITNITSEHTGLYHLEIIREKTETHSFSVSLSPKVKIVKERDSVSLHIDVTDEQRNEKIHWKIKHNNSLVAEIITENGKISTSFIEERFRDRLKLDDQTGDLIITHMKNEDFGLFEADVTIGHTHTLHKTFSVTDSDVQIEWRFKGDHIAKIIREVNSDPVYDSDVRFTDRLKMNPQTGDLTITNITSEHTGLYHLVILGGIIVSETFSLRVFGDDTERVSVNDGGSVTLHTHVTELKGDELIMWRFKGDRIARIYRDVNSDPVYEPDVRFTDILKMNPQTGDLTITNITSELTGDYQLENFTGKTETKSFIVSLSPKVKIVKERDSVSLHIDVTEEQRNEKIHWKIKHNNSPVAEVITENGKISTPFIEERFRDRLKLDDQTGDLIITHMKNEDSGQYEADVTIGHTHTIHKTFSFTDSGQSVSLPLGVIVGVCVSLTILVFAVVVIYCQRKRNRPDTGEESIKMEEHLRNRDDSNLDVPPL